MIEDGVYTVVNPRTGGHRTFRITHCQAETFKGYWKNLGELTRIAEYLEVGKWVGMAFVYPANGGQVRVWTRQSQRTTEVAGLKWLVAKGVGREEELRGNYEAHCGSTCTHEPAPPADPLELAEDVARQRWEKSDV